MLSSGGACNIKELARWRFILVFLILYYSMYSYFKLAFILVQVSVLFVPLYYCLALFLVNKVVLFQLVGSIIKIFHLIFTFNFGLFQSREKKINNTNTGLIQVNFFIINYKTAYKYKAYRVKYEFT